MNLTDKCKDAPNFAYPPLRTPNLANKIEHPKAPQRYFGAPNWYQSWMLQLVLTGGFIIYGISLIDFKGFVAIFARMHKLYYLLFFLCQFIPLIFLTIRWKIILKSLKIRVPFGCNWWKIFGIVYSSAFFNNFLPGVVGGDLVKAIIVVKGADKNEYPLGAAIGSVFLDRIIGLAALTFLGCFTISFNLGGSFISLAIIIYGLAAIEIIFYFVYFSPQIRNLGLVKKIFNFLPAKQEMREIDDVLKKTRQNRYLVLKCFFLSIVSQVVYILTTFGFAKALHIEGVSFWHLLIFMPLVWIISMLPISFGGWGIAEVSLGLLFSTINISSNQAIALCLLNRASSIIFTLGGGIIFVPFLIKRKSRIPNLTC